MRLLVDEHFVPWKDAWEITQKTFGYTNHTLLPEALEKWPVSMFERLLPRHMQIIYQINFEFLSHVSMLYPGDVARLRRMSIIDESGERYVRMAFLAIIGSHSVNGVAALHSELLKSTVLKDFYDVYPKIFNNKTNGVTQRRWVLKANPTLSELITSKIGKSWITNLYQLKDLEKFVDDKDFIKEWQKIKAENKKVLAKIIKKDTGVDVDPNSMFDVQVKRLHEYKRQLLNVLQIIHLYIELKSSNDAEMKKNFVPRTFIFGAKAAPGYYMAKLIIKLINSVAEVVNNDPRVDDMIKVVFLPDYKVSLAEKLIPATDVSIQSSTAGYEASGTSNMKFALNGALTVGTYDGANIEIYDAVGQDNFYLFGLHDEEIKQIRAKNSYNPREEYENSNYLQRILNTLNSNMFCEKDYVLIFKLIYEELLNRDFYFILKDLPAFRDACEQAAEDFTNKDKWTKKAIMNVARIGYFSSDRSISEYAKNIWNVKAV
jgi:starch phosphorylase